MWKSKWMEKLTPWRWKASQIVMGVSTSYMRKCIFIMLRCLLYTIYTIYYAVFPLSLSLRNTTGARAQTHTHFITPILFDRWEHRQRWCGNALSTQWLPVILGFLSSVVNCRGVNVLQLFDLSLDRSPCHLAFVACINVLSLDWFTLALSVLVNITAAWLDDAMYVCICEQELWVIKPTIKFQYISNKPSHSVEIQMTDYIQTLFIITPVLQ